MAHIGGGLVCRAAAVTALVAAMTVTKAPPPAQRDAAPGRQERISGDEIPAGLNRDEWAQIRGSLETSSYHARLVTKKGGAQALVAVNRQQGYRSEFRRNGIEIVSRAAPDQDWRLGVSVTGFGYDGEVRPLPIAEPVAEKGRVEYRRGPVTEWYENRPGGLEQGFTIAEPEPRGSRPFVLAMAVEGGLHPRLEAAGAAFSDNAGRTRVRYAGLAAWDADGRVLPSWLEASELELRIFVDAGEARFPVTVDPTFLQEARLLASDAAPGDRIGWSVSVSGDTALVGVNQDVTMGGSAAGSAYVFVRSGTVWSQQQKLVASDAQAYAYFGISVAVSGDTVVVGAYGDDNSGSAYVFVRSGTVWSEQQKLVAADGAAGDSFGVSVSIAGETAVVGAVYDDTAGGTDAGSAYVFVRSGTAWSQQQKLLASDGEAGDWFGHAVSVVGDTAVVGAYKDDTAGGVDAGSAYVFARSGTVWGEQQMLVASDGASSDYFGVSVSISGDTALVGAWQDDTGGGLNAGSAYVFVRSGTTWSQQQRLVASDGTPSDNFGISVSLSGDTALVGAYRDGAGSAYTLVRSGTLWSQQEKLVPAPMSGRFGISVSLSGDTALVGAYLDSETSPEAGAAYIFRRSRADLGVTKTDGVTSVAAGAGLTYTISVTNAGPQTTGASVVDTFPATLVCSTTCVGTGGATCAAGPFAGNINDTVNLPAGQAVTYTSTCTVAITATGTLTNTATVTQPGTVYDPNPSNNSATDVDTVVAAPSLSLNDVTQPETNSGTTTFGFTVTLTPASGVQATVNYTTANVTAMAGSDYVATNGMLTFAPGETSKPINVTVNGDGLFEPTETFNVTLSGASMATIGDGTGVGTITNDDIPPARVFVSVLGVDTNDCSNALTPCRTLGAAISQVATDGEVIVTRSGSYAGATISKGVKITAAAGVVAFSGQPITVNSGGGTTVVLRGLTLKAVTPGTGTGLLIQSAGAVFVENCTIDGWDIGIRQQGAAEAFVKDSTLRNTNTGLYATTGKTAVDATRLTNNGIGIASDVGEVSVRGSTLSGNTTAGIYADSSSSVTVDKCQITNNGAGVTLPAASLAAARLSRSAVSGNGIGLQNVGGTLEVNGTNVIRGNTTDTTGTITTTGLQ